MSKQALRYAACLAFVLAACAAHVGAGEMPEKANIDFSVLNESGLIERDGDTLTATWKNMPSDGDVMIMWREPGSGKEGYVNARIEDGKAKFDNPNPKRRVVFKFPTTEKNFVTLAERKVFAPGMDNLRDMGGYRTEDGRHTKWGLLYRGDTPFKLKQDGYRYVNDMNMGYIFDLRTEGQASRKPVPAFEGVKYMHTQIPDDPPEHKEVSWDTYESIFSFVKTKAARDFYYVTNRYMARAPLTAESLRKIFKNALAANGKAMIWHCSGGKDRTGIVGAVFLSTLGVPDETIVNDYLLTSVYRWDFDVAELAEMEPHFHGDADAMIGFKAIQASRPEYIMTAMNTIRKDHGSIKNYVTNVLGISEDQIEQLKRMYLE